MRRKQKDEELTRPGRWLLIAQEEIASRLRIDQAEHEASLERELQMQARIKATYPDLPLGLALEFSRRLEAGYFTWESWDEAVGWLEATDWFASR